MKRALILLALAALPLAGCSGKAKAPDAAVAAGGSAKPNPWSKDGAGPDPKVGANLADTKPSAKSTAAPTNPWAKDPPPGAKPSETAAAKDKPKAE
ncbi:MAG: hypothetical protein QFC78_10895 [Pseudomonadota bacterium]|nr:hypothetical protein [Pseudomonadota bacterium]